MTQEQGSMQQDTCLRHSDIRTGDTCPSCGKTILRQNLGGEVQWTPEGSDVPFQSPAAATNLGRETLHRQDPHSRLDHVFDMVGEIIVRIERVKAMHDGKVAELTERIEKLEGVAKPLGQRWKLQKEMADTFAAFVEKWKPLISGNEGTPADANEFHLRLLELVCAACDDAVKGGSR